MKIKSFWITLALASAAMLSAPAALAQDSEIASLRAQLQSALDRIEALERQREVQGDAQERPAQAVRPARIAPSLSRNWAPV